MKISTLGNPQFCAWCAYIKNKHMKNLISCTTLIKQLFDLNDHQDIPQNWLTVLYFQIHPKSTTFQGKIWYKMWWILRNFQCPWKSYRMSFLKMLLERHKEQVQSIKFFENSWSKIWYALKRHTIYQQYTKWTIYLAQIRQIWVESDERRGKISSTPSKMCH